MFLTLDNSAQVDVLKEKKNIWINWLKEILQTATPIEIQASVASQEEIQKHKIPYTNQEKWQFLIQKYPYLEQIRKRLGLIIE